MSANLILLILCGIACLILVFLNQSFSKFIKSLSWKIGFGKILETETSRLEFEDGVFFEEKIRFEYEIEGKAYQGFQKNFSSNPKPLVNDKVSIFYHPTFPDKAFLKELNYWKTAICICGLLSFFSIGVILGIKLFGIIL